MWMLVACAVEEGPPFRPPPAPRPESPLWSEVLVVAGRGGPGGGLLLWPERPELPPISFRNGPDAPPHPGAPELWTGPRPTEPHLLGVVGWILPSDLEEVHLRTERYGAPVTIGSAEVELDVRPWPDLAPGEVDVALVQPDGVTVHRREWLLRREGDRAVLVLGRRADADALGREAQAASEVVVVPTFRSGALAMAVTGADAVVAGDAVTLAWSDRGPTEGRSPAPALIYEGLDERGQARFTGSGDLTRIASRWMSAGPPTVAPDPRVPVSVALTQVPHEGRVGPTESVTDGHYRSPAYATRALDDRTLTLLVDPVDRPWLARWLEGPHDSLTVSPGDGSLVDRRERPPAEFPGLVPVRPR